MDEQLRTPKPLIPERLATICTNYIALNLKDTIASDEKQHGVLNLRKNQPFLISSIADEILSTFTEYGYTLSDKELHIFNDSSKTRLSSVDLSNSEVTDSGLQWLTRHPIESIDISNCDELTVRTTQKHIFKMAPKLKILKLGNKTFLLTQLTYAESEDGEKMSRALKRLAEEDKLMVLTMHKIPRFCMKVVDNFLSSLHNIQYLDLSEPADQGNLGHLHSLKHLKCLCSLILHKAYPFGSDINIYLPSLMDLKSLRHLDISTKGNPGRATRFPSVKSQAEALQELLKALPHLRSLDISGTHLAGVEEVNGSESCAIPGLAGRHFDFLGLLDCVGKPCGRENLPATKVTGHTTVEKIMESLRRYKHRHEYVTVSLNDLYPILNHGLQDLSLCAEMLSLTTEVMKTFKENQELTMVGSAVMCYLLNINYHLPDVHTYTSAKEIRKAVWVLFSCINERMDDKSFLRNGLLALFNLRIPEDVAFIYTELARLLLIAIHRADPEREELLLRISLHFLNKMIRGDGSDKQHMGKLGTVQEMSNLIHGKLRFDFPDDVMNLAWSTLWNLTDEMAENCIKFVGSSRSPQRVEINGLSLFRSCYLTFCTTNDESGRESREELLRNMMGLMGNIAEVKSLRPKLSQPFFLSLFRKLISSPNYSIEVSYHAAGILCHILSDDPDPSIWMAAYAMRGDVCEDELTVHEDTESGAQVTQPTEVDDMTNPSDFSMVDTSSDEEDWVDIPAAVTLISRPMHSDAMDPEEGKREVLTALVDAMETWDKKSERCINYRSFAPILELLQCPHTVEVRHWACWVLCNLTTVYPTRYCSLLKGEHGLQMLEDILSRPEHQTGEVMALASITLTNCRDALGNPSSPTLSS